MTRCSNKSRLPTACAVRSRTATSRSRRRSAQETTPRDLRATKLAYLALDRIVGAQIRHRVGLDRARVLVSGAASTSPDLLRWLHSIGLRVAEVYGQTEDCGPTSLNPPERIRIGTVGPPVPGVTVRIAADGEILVRGPNVCIGYFKDRAATRAAHRRPRLDALGRRRPH